MANTTLRAYLRDLEQLIDREALEEVIGHCKYILTKFPKNAEVYRVYGRALVGKARYEEARDIFERVLSAAPNDFAAHISMSEIFQEEGLEGLSRAIWHLERAYEQDPNNQMLQDELRRLYDQRDGAPPDTIQMTRGALARLYYKSQLFDQATAELNAALKEAPDRPDLMILLAETQWNNGRPLEAAETALRILKHFPYSVDANRIMAQLWLTNNRPSDAQPFIERLGEIDPFQALALVRPGDYEAGDEITIQRLDWNSRSSAAMLSSAPDWVQGMGDFFGDTPASPTSDDPFGFASPGRTGESRMGNFAAASDVPVPKTDWFSASSSFSQAAQGGSAGDLPDWFADVQIPTTPAPAAIPSWLDDGADDLAMDEQATTPPRTPTGFTDLLGEFGVTGTSATGSGASDPMPDWMIDAMPADQGMSDLPDLSYMPDFSETPDLPTASVDASGFTGLLEEFGDADNQPKPDFPSWLDDIAAAPQSPAAATGTGTGFTGLLQEFGGSEADAQPLATTDIPSWLNDSPELSAPDDAPEIPSWMSTPTLDIAPPIPSSGWTGDLAGLSTPPEAEITHDNDWTPDSAADDAPAQPAEAFPSWLSDMPKAAQPSPLDSLGSLSDFGSLDNPNFDELLSSNDDEPQSESWLAELGGVSPAPSMGADLPPQPLTSGSGDDWLSAMHDEPPELPTTGNTPQSVEDVIAAVSANDWLNDLSDSTPLPSTPIATPTSDEDWLTSMRDMPGMSDDAEPLVSAADAPDWMTDTGAVSATESERQPEADPLDWMSDPQSLDETISDEIETLDPIAAGLDAGWLSDPSRTIKAPTEKKLTTDELLDWMSEAGSKAEPTSTQPDTSLAGLEALNMDDWMNDLAVLDDTPEPVASTQPPTTPAELKVDDLDALDLDGWLGDLDKLPAVTDNNDALAPELSPLDMNDDWLKDFDLGDGEAAIPGMGAAEAKTSTAPVSSADAPMLEEDWLAGFEPEVVRPETPAPPVVQTPASDNWLDSLAASAPPPREPLTLQEAIIQPPEADTNDWLSGATPDVTPGDWLNSLGTAISPSDADTAEAQATDDVVPDWMRDMPSIDVAPELPADAQAERKGMTDILSRIKARGDSPIVRETGVLNPDILPDWMKALSDEPASQAADATPEPVADTQAPETASSDADWLNNLGMNDEPISEAVDYSDLFAAQATSDPSSFEIAPSSASDLRDEFMADSPEPEPVVSDPLAGMTDWLTDLRASEAEEPDAEVSGIDSLDYGTDAMDADSQAAADYGTASTDTGDVPDWLAGIRPVELETPLEGDFFNTSLEAIDFGSTEPKPAELDFDNIDIDQLLSEVQADPAGLAKDGEKEDNTSSASRFAFDRLPAWLRKRN